MKTGVYIIPAVMISIALHFFLAFIPQSRHLPVPENRPLQVTYRSIHHVHEDSAAENLQPEAGKTEPKVKDNIIKPEKRRNNSSTIEETTRDQKMEALQPSSQETAVENTGLGYSNAAARFREKLLANLTYPAVARKKKWTGTVELSVTLDENGNLMDISVKQTSGYALLDTAALDLIDSILPFRHGLGSSIIFVVPVSYRLKFNNGSQLD
ncbi:MAG: energy transducer TonB [Spirochaetales bacterium]|nr:energy transducer TonB [Spirochaetales bacterium]